MNETIKKIVIEISDETQIIKLKGYRQILNGVTLQQDGICLYYIEIQYDHPPEEREHRLKVRVIKTGQKTNEFESLMQGSYTGVIATKDTEYHVFASYDYH